MGDDIQLAQQAAEGDVNSLELLISGIRGDIYGLSLRMLYHPDDAEDATQEILIKIVTRLASFRGDSSFSTWAFRVAANHLRDIKRSKPEFSAVPFDELDGRIRIDDPGPWDENMSPGMQRLIVEEMRISCLQGLLQSLDRNHRLAYLLAEVFGVSGEQGARILDITPQAFRKRLSRAKSRLGGWMSSKCSLIKTENPCSCDRQARHHANEGRMGTERMTFAAHPCRKRKEPGIAAGLTELDEMKRVSALFRSEPSFQAPGMLTELLRELVQSESYSLMRSQNSPNQKP